MCVGDGSGGSGHGAEKFGVGLGFGEAAEQQFHGFDGRERAQHFAQNPDAAEFVWRKQDFVFTRAGALDIDGGEDALVGEAAVEIDFHVTGALEFFEDDVVHAAAGVDQRGGDDGERAAFFHVASGGEEAARTLQSVGVDTAGEHFAGRRSDGVVGAREASDAVEQHDDVALVFDEALGFFQHHFGDLNVALRSFVEGGADDFALDGALHVGDFFGALVDEQHDERDFRMIDGDGIGHGLQHHGFAGARRSDDQAALAFADGAEQVEHAPGHVFLGGFHLEAALGIKRRQVVEENFVAGDFGIFEVDGFDFDQSEVALAIFGRANLAGDGVAGAQVEFANLRRRNVDVVGAGEIVVLRGAEKTETVGEAFEDAFGEDEAVLFGLGAEDLEDQFLLAHAAGAGDVEFLGDLGEIGDVFFFEFSKANAHRISFQLVSFIGPVNLLWVNGLVG